MQVSDMLLILGAIQLNTGVLEKNREQHSSSHQNDKGVTDLHSEPATQ